MNNQNMFPNSSFMQQPFVGDMLNRQPVATPAYKSNRLLVTSLSEAISRSYEYGTETYYFDQNKPVFYIVRVDYGGRKTWAEVPYGTPTPDENTPATRADLNTLAQKIEELEARLLMVAPKAKKAKTEVIENGESVG